MRTALQLITISIVFSASLQACSLAPKTINPEMQRLAMERYNNCMQRFTINATQVCEGHRRDFLATYPVYMQNHVDTLLSKKFEKNRSESMLRTGVDVDALADHLRSAISAN